MSFRPQFDYKLRPEVDEQDAIYYWDSITVPSLLAAMVPGQVVDSIPLATQQTEAPFWWRGFQMSVSSQGVWGVRFRDPAGNYLSDDFVVVQQYAGLIVVALESEVYCPAGCVLLMDLKRIS